MLTPEQRTAIAQQTRALQIIIFALVAGVASYLAFAVLNRHEEGERNLGLIAVAFTAAAVTAALVAPNIIAAQQRRAIAEGKPSHADTPATGDVGQLLAAYQTQKIIRGALFEGPAFMNIFVYQIGGPTYTLGIAVALMLAIAMQFPFRRLVEDWLDRELRTVEELRQLNRY
jgi:hypothetical protein